MCPTCNLCMLCTYNSINIKLYIHNGMNNVHTTLLQHIKYYTVKLQANEKSMRDGRTKKNLSS